MEYLLHVVQVHHAFDNIEQDFDLFKGSELLLLFVELVEKTAVFEVFGDKSVFVCGDAHAHIKDNVRVF